MDDFVTSLKFAVGGLISTIMSYTLWRYKKNQNRLETLSNMVNELSTDQRIVDVEIRTIKDDIIEIKDTLKEILKKM